MNANEWMGILAALASFLGIIQAFATTDIFSNEFHEKVRQFVHKIFVVKFKFSAPPCELMLTQGEITRFVMIGAVSPLFIFLSRGYKFAAFLTLIVGVIGILMNMFANGGAVTGEVKGMFVAIAEGLSVICMAAVVILTIVQIMLVMSRKQLYKDI